MYHIAITPRFLDALLYLLLSLGRGYVISFGHVGACMSPGRKLGRSLKLLTVVELKKDTTTTPVPTTYTRRGSIMFRGFPTHSKAVF